jgi:hypothetical protein
MYVCIHDIQFLWIRTTIQTRGPIVMTSVGWFFPFEDNLHFIDFHHLKRIVLLSSLDVSEFVSSSFRILKLVIIGLKLVLIPMYTFHNFQRLFDSVMDMEFYNWRLKLGITKGISFTTH